MKKIISIMLTVMMAATACAQENVFKLRGKVMEAKNRVQLLECKVEVLSAADSVVLDSAISTQRIENGADITYLSEFTLKIPRKEGQYLLRVSKAGFRTALVPLDLSHFYRREFQRRLPTVYLHHDEVVSLDEVTVNATKIMFYLKGDTIVYNANAFKVAEGSMLDALIKMLPGAELRSNGQIWVNGRKVERLLLNGKDFFKGDNRVLLDNLPNYMVQDIKVYEHRGEDSHFLGRDVQGDVNYAMDVRLKKQYNIGFSGNVEAGAGTAHRFLARLFAMRFTNHSRVGAYANVNNINSLNKEGDGTALAPTKGTNGTTTMQVGGLDYNIDDRNERFHLSGDIQIKAERGQVQTQSYETNFMAGGDIYNRMRTNAINRNTAFTTHHRLYREWDMANLEIKPTFEYKHYRNNDHYAMLSARSNTVFSDNIAADSLFSLHLPSSILPLAINGNGRQTQSTGHQWEAGLAVKSNIKFMKSPDNLTLYAKASYTDARGETFDNNLVNYYAQGAAGPSDFRNRYFDTKPNKGFSLNTQATYTYIPNAHFTIELSGAFDRSVTRSYSSLYLLHQLTDWGMGTSHVMGNLPEVSDLLQTLDAPNSYHGKLTTNKSTLQPFVMWHKDTETSNWQAQINLPLSMLHRRYAYRRDQMDTVVTKNTALIHVQSSFVRWKKRDQTMMAMLQYNLNTVAPDMNFYLNVHDTTDPLHVRQGNSALTNTRTHELTLSFSRLFPQKRTMLMANVLFRPVENAIAMTYTYNPKTGVKTYKPENVDGCWTGALSFGGFCPLDKQKKLNLKSAFITGYSRSVDLVETLGLNEPAQSHVGTTHLTALLQLRYSLGKISLGLQSESSWQHTTGSRSHFTPFSALELKNSLTALVPLPANMQLNTDLTLYTRSGYADASMNTTDWVWNVNFNVPLAKGKWLIKATGYDLLHGLSNVTRVLNAQSLTETYTTAIPRFVMLSATYRFSTKPQ